LISQNWEKTNKIAVAKQNKINMSELVQLLGSISQIDKKISHKYSFALLFKSCNNNSNNNNNNNLIFVY
jgi:hypothetical protein